MKNLKYLVLILFALGACTEIEYRDVEKEVIKRDTVVKFIDRFFQSSDTVEITTIVEVPTPTRSQNDSIVYIIKFDTVTQIRIDTVWRERVVYEEDTVYRTRTVYSDTLYITYGRSTQSVDPALFEMWLSFFDEAQARGYEVWPLNMIVERVKLDSVQQAYSFDIYNQLWIKINDNLTDDECFVPLWRELARQMLHKEYSQDPNSVMYYYFDNNLIRWSNRAQHKEEINEFFK